MALINKDYSTCLESFMKMNISVSIRLYITLHNQMCMISFVLCFFPHAEWPTHVTGNVFHLITRRQNFQRGKLCVWTAVLPSTWTCMRDLVGSSLSSLFRMRRWWGRLLQALDRPPTDSKGGAEGLWMGCMGGMGTVDTKGGNRATWLRI